MECYSASEVRSAMTITDTKRPHIHWSYDLGFAISCFVAAYTLGRYTRHPGLFFLLVFAPVLMVVWQVFRRFREQVFTESGLSDSYTQMNEWMDKASTHVFWIGLIFWTASFTVFHPYPKFLNIPSSIQSAKCSGCGQVFDRNDLVYVIEEPGMRPRYYCNKDWAAGVPDEVDPETGNIVDRDQ